MPSPQGENMKKSTLASLALAGASMLLAAPQTAPPKPTNEPASQTEAGKGEVQRKKKTRQHKEKYPAQQQQQTQKAPQK
jgi:hypothetical protein